jgi:CubicO group peptidase (beta-lactamase class C family)
MTVPVDSVIDVNELEPPDLIAPPRGLAAPRAQEPNPQWAEVFDAALGTTAMGYAYVVTCNGTVVAYDEVNWARSPHALTNPSLRWATNTPCNLASVSKTVTAIAIMTLVQEAGALDLLQTPFWDVLQPRYPSITPGSGVDQVTIQQLLTMTSGLVPDGTLYLKPPETVDSFLEAYLQQPVVSPPPAMPVYSNTNFTILQVVYEQRTGQGLVAGVTNNVLTPMGIDSDHFTVVPERPDTALSYAGAEDTRPGYFWPQIQCVGPGGWLATTDQLSRYLIGIVNGSVLDQQMLATMLTGSLGWYSWYGNYGTYYHHNGGLRSGEEYVNTGVVLFTNGYQAALLVNSPVSNPRIIPLMVEAFEAGTRD